MCLSERMNVCVCVCEREREREREREELLKLKREIKLKTMEKKGAPYTLFTLTQLSIRPLGVASKKDMGERKMLKCILLNN